jgi:hypothetical protein
LKFRGKSFLSFICQLEMLSMKCATFPRFEYPRMLTWTPLVGGLKSCNLCLRYMDRSMRDD